MRMGSGSMINNMQGQLKEMGAETIVNTFLQKLKEFLLGFVNFGGQFLDWLDEVFPPGSRKEQIQHWLHVCAPFVIAGLTLVVLFWCCSRCIRCLCTGNTVTMMALKLLLLLLMKGKSQEEDERYSEDEIEYKEMPFKPTPDRISTTSTRMKPIYSNRYYV